jgi:glycosyltransferase involved in cell wall biosynthesis
MGGFGWAAKQAATCFQSDPSLGVDPILLMGERVPATVVRPDRVHGCEVVWIGSSILAWASAVRAAQVDLFLSIDYRSNYGAFYALCPRTPILLWVRDPRERRDQSIIDQLRIPGDPHPPLGVGQHRTHTLAPLLALSRLFARPFRMAVTTPAFKPKIQDTYGVSGDSAAVLPNIIEPCTPPLHKADTPVVVYLARLDPLKRPWLMEALARRIPEAEFVVMGKNHFQGPGSWKPATDIPNIRYLGHIEGQLKQAQLERGWVLLNTSLHEGLAVSYLEAFMHEMPLVSCVDTEGLATRFGRAIDRHPGDGMDALPAFENALRELITDHALRARLGRESRAWVEATHSRESFLHSFFALAREMGVVRQ